VREKIAFQKLLRNLHPYKSAVHFLKILTMLYCVITLFTFSCTLLYFLFMYRWWFNTKMLSVLRLFIYLQLFSLKSLWI